MTFGPVALKALCHLGRVVGVRFDLIRWLKVWVWIRVSKPTFAFSAIRFFFYSAWTVTSHVSTVQRKNTVYALFIHGSRTIYALFTDPTALFTHLKIILLQCFRFSVFSFSKNKLYPNGPKEYPNYWCKCLLMCTSTCTHYCLVHNFSIFPSIFVYNCLGLFLLVINPMPLSSFFQHRVI